MACQGLYLDPGLTFGVTSRPAIGSKLGVTMKTLALALVLFLPTVVLAKPRWRSATVTKIVLPDDEEQAGGPKDTDMLGVKISSGCIGYRLKADDGIYVLEFCLNPMEQHNQNSKSPFEGAPDVTVDGVVRIWVQGYEAHILDNRFRDIKLHVVATPMNPPM